MPKAQYVVFAIFKKQLFVLCKMYKMCCILQGLKKKNEHITNRLMSGIGIFKKEVVNMRV